MRRSVTLAPLIAGVTLTLAIPAASAHAGVVLSQPPNQLGNSLSDTSWSAGGTSPDSQQLADDFMLDTPATVRQVTWWGSYFGGPPQTNETFRIRCYEADPGNALPGNVLSESTVFDPPRQATGLFVAGLGVRLAEYVFEATLATPISLSPNVPYWLEIAQFGDPDSGFAWEDSSVNQNGFAFQSPSGSQWQLTSSTADLAFQLSTAPEPGPLALVALGFGLAGNRSKRRAR